MDFNKFTYEKKQIIHDGATFYFWYLINKEERNGVHFHGARVHNYERHNSSALGGNNAYQFNTYGVESHSTKPTYEGQNVLHDCAVTGGDCYCDGSSLVASENLGHIDPDDCDEEVWRLLHRLYQSWHEETTK